MMMFLPSWALISLPVRIMSYTLLNGGRECNLGIGAQFFSGGLAVSRSDKKPRRGAASINRRPASRFEPMSCGPPSDTDPLQMQLRGLRIARLLVTDATRPPCRDVRATRQAITGSYDAGRGGRPT